LFELKLKSFKNDKGKDNIGACCSGVSDASGKCIGTCKTRFRVCLKHYQAKIDLKSPCTFGDVITPVLGDNTFNMSLADQPTIKGFVNSIRFPFDFAWPVSKNHLILCIIIDPEYNRNNLLLLVPCIGSKALCKRL
jgi:delta